MIALSWYRLTQPAPVAWDVIQGETMGTTYTVKLLASLDRGARAEIEIVLEKVNAGMSTYREDSELSRFNTSGTNPFKLSTDVFQIMYDALQLSRETSGAFDITVGPIVNAYGFGPDIQIELPTEAELETLRPRVGYQHLSLDESVSTIQKDTPEVYCDLSAIAKGYGVDEVVRVLESKSVENYFVEIGGEVRCSGTNPDGVPWRIGIEKPLAKAREVHRIVSLSDRAMATSGTYRNYVEANGKQVSHTIDPRTGRPVSHSVLSLTVIHDSCEWADGYATALTVMGEKEGLAFAQNHNLAVLMLIKEENGTLREAISPAFESYLEENVTDESY
ncbi:MAG: FAD:protein FMN transferase [Candidatus Hydrogenedentota bacterium]